MRYSLYVIGIAAAVAACSSEQPDDTTVAADAGLEDVQPGSSTGAASPGTAADADPLIHYLCEDDTTLDVRYPDTETAQLLRNDEAIDMKIAISASGARYTGGGWEWWTKAGTGTLSPLEADEEIASAPGISCSEAS